jgi:integrase
MSVQQRRGKYFPVLYVRDPKTGKASYKWYAAYPTQKAAERAERKLRAELDQGKSIDRPKETVEQFLRRWLAFKQTDGTAAKTLEGYRDIIQTRWIPAVGGVRMSAFVADPSFILEVQNEWFARGVVTRNRGSKPRTIIPRKQTVRNYRRCLHTALEDNTKWTGQPNPSARVDIPTVDDAEEIVTLTREESLSLQAAAARAPFCDDMRTQVILFGLYMAMREGELLALRRHDIDRAARLVYVRQTLSVLRGKGAVIQPNHTKNKASNAPVELSDGALGVLVRAAAIQSDQLHRAGSAWTDHDKLVFTASDGRPIHPNEIRRQLQRMLNAAGVTRVTVHALRHTHATLLLEDGVHPKLVQERLRHSRIGVTMDTYSHVIPTLRSATTARVDRLFGTGTLDDSLDSADTEAQESEREFAF